MPNAQLWILESCAEVIFFQTGTIRELFILKLFTIKAVFVFSIRCLECLIAYPRHGEPKRIIPTNPFFIRTPFRWRSDFGVFKELL